ncbi:transmembrane protein, putative [Medicago truncatula]|uniref:Transmembrane protein, putative n=1 Tax=Medicago truncatula TaxID=3880 RepID=A0A072VJV5_MEDTR|nr:transmembrane protein, putative [Medicago truncatula]
MFLATTITIFIIIITRIMALHYGGSFTFTSVVSNPPGSDKFIQPIVTGTDHATTHWNIIIRFLLRNSNSNPLRVLIHIRVV